MNDDGRRARWKSPWLWIGLSCAVLVVAAGGLFVAMNMILFKAFRQASGQSSGESVLKAAEDLARRDANLTVVSRDPKNRAVTLRNRQTGERFVLGQLGKDKLRIGTSLGEVVPQFSGAGGLNSSGDEEARLRLGSAAGSPPAWVPVAPGGQAHPVYVLEANGVASGCHVVDAGGPLAEVYDFYRRELARRGLKVLPGGSAGVDGAFVSASSPDWRSSLYVSAFSPPGRRPAVLLTWSEMQDGAVPAAPRPPRGP